MSYMTVYFLELVARDARGDKIDDALEVALVMAKEWKIRGGKGSANAQTHEAAVAGVRARLFAYYMGKKELEGGHLGAKLVFFKGIVAADVAQLVVVKELGELNAEVRAQFFGSLLLWCLYERKKTQEIEELLGWAGTDKESAILHFDEGLGFSPLSYALFRLDPPYFELLEKCLSNEKQLEIHKDDFRNFDFFLEIPPRAFSKRVDPEEFEEEIQYHGKLLEKLGESIGGVANLEKLVSHIDMKSKVKVEPWERQLLSRIGHKSIPGDFKDWGAYLTNLREILSVVDKAESTKVPGKTEVEALMVEFVKKDYWDYNIHHPFTPTRRMQDMARPAVVIERLLGQLKLDKVLFKTVPFLESTVLLYQALINNDVEKVKRHRNVLLRVSREIENAALKRQMEYAIKLCQNKKSTNAMFFNLFYALLGFESKSSLKGEKYSAFRELFDAWGQYVQKVSEAPQHYNTCFAKSYPSAREEFDAAFIALSELLKICLDIACGENRTLDTSPDKFKRLTDFINWSIRTSPQERAKRQSQAASFSLKMSQAMHPINHSTKGNDNYAVSATITPQFSYMVETVIADAVNDILECEVVKDEVKLACLNSIIGDVPESDDKDELFDGYAALLPGDLQLRAIILRDVCLNQPWKHYDLQVFMKALPEKGEISEEETRGYLAEVAMQQIGDAINNTATILVTPALATGEQLAKFLDKKEGEKISRLHPGTAKEYEAVMPGDGVDDNTTIMRKLHAAVMQKNLGVLGQIADDETHPKRIRAEAYHHKGVLHLQVVGGPQEAKQSLESALKLTDGFSKDNRLEMTLTARILHNLGVVEANLGSYNEAEEYYKQALILNDKLYGDGVHSDMLSNLSNMIALYYNTQDWKQAESLQERKIALLKKAGEGFKIILVDDLIKYGHIFKHQSLEDKAYEVYAEAHKAALQLPDNFQVKQDFLNRVSLAYSSLKRYEEALGVSLEVKRIIGTLTLINTALTYTGLAILGEVYINYGHHKQDLSLCRKGIMELEALYERQIEMWRPDLLRILAHGYHAIGCETKAQCYGKLSQKRAERAALPDAPPTRYIRFKASDDALLQMASEIQKEIIKPIAAAIEKNDANLTKGVVKRNFTFTSRRIRNMSSEQQKMAKALCFEILNLSMVLKGEIWVEAIGNFVKNNPEIVQECISNYPQFFVTPEIVEMVAGVAVNKELRVLLARSATQLLVAETKIKADINISIETPGEGAYVLPIGTSTISYSGGRNER